MRFHQFYTHVQLDTGLKMQIERSSSGSSAIFLIPLYVIHVFLSFPFTVFPFIQVETGILNARDMKFAKITYKTMRVSLKKINIKLT